MLDGQLFLSLLFGDMDSQLLSAHIRGVMHNAWHSLWKSLQARHGGRV